MKIKKTIILLISIIVPLVITVLIALYSYGILGGWTGNQEKFINKLFYETDSTDTSIDNYLKFNSDKYFNNSVNMKVFKDYEAENLEYIEAENGKYKFNNFTFSSYVLISEHEEYPSYNYSFWFYDLNNQVINPDNIVLIFVSEESVGSTTNLKKAISQFKDEYVGGTEVSTYAAKTSSPNANVLFSGASLKDHNGVGTTNSEGELQTPYIHWLKPGYEYIIQDSEGADITSTSDFKELDFCSFAIFELKYDADGDQSDAEVLTTGQIENIHNKSEEFIANNNCSEGYGLDPTPALNKAGYFSYVFPTIIWQSAVSLAVCGILSFLFYSTWAYEEKTPNNKKTRS